MAGFVDIFTLKIIIRFAVGPVERLKVLGVADSCRKFGTTKKSEVPITGWRFP
jgi:hypothetical protein